MAAPMEGEFDAWLGKKLQSLNPDTDLDVFVEYIRGILETETSAEDRNESLIGILAGITEDELEVISEEIIQKWTDTTGPATAQNETNEWNNMDRVAAIMAEQQKKSVIQTRELSAEEKARKAAILAQYAQVSDGEASDEEEPAGGGGGGSGAKASAGDGIDDFLAENVNARLVVDREKNEREKSRKEADDKRQKDKADREKQKQKADDRKEAEKKRTTKGERRR